MLKRMLHRALRLTHGLLMRHLIPYLGFLVGFTRGWRQKRFAWPVGQPTMAPRVAVFVHFDSRGIVQPYVRHYLRALGDAGCSVVFVTNAGKLRPDSLEAIKPLCAGILIRRNIGYDFSAMREGLAHFALPRPDTEMLIIANDSVYGPLGGLDDILARVDFAKADLWGATDSWQGRYHLQSYFLVAGPAAFGHAKWQRFWAQVRPLANKHEIIRRYEIGITQWMLRAGLRCAAIWPYSELIRAVDPEEMIGGYGAPSTLAGDPVQKMREAHAMRLRMAFSRNVPLNPTSELWRQLLAAGYPFLKRELLRNNPSRVPGVADWRSAVLSLTDGDVEMIETDLQRQLKNRAP
jgi:hypothetical protein